MSEVINDEGEAIENGWVYIINPKERTIQHKQILLDFDHMKEIMGCSMGEIVQLGHGLVMVCDENARLLDKKSRSHFRWVFRRNEDGSMSPNRYIESDTRPTEEIVFCNTCIVGSFYNNDEDLPEWCSTQLHLWQLAQCVDFLHASYHDEPEIEVKVFDNFNDIFGNDFSDKPTKH